MYVEVPIAAVTSETADMRLLQLDTPFAEAYRTPGQYVKIKLEDKESYFALASAPGRDLILVAAGSGVGPLRAVIQTVLARPSEFGQVTLFHGQRAEEDF